MKKCRSFRTLRNEYTDPTICLHCIWTVMVKTFVNQLYFINDIYGISKGRFTLIKSECEFDLCHWSMETLNWILYEYILKRCYFCIRWTTDDSTLWLMAYFHQWRRRQRQIPVWRVSLIITLYYAELFPLVWRQRWRWRLSLVVTVPILGTDLHPNFTIF